MKKSPTKQLYSKEELEGHKKGPEYVSKELARQEKLDRYPKLDEKPPSNLDYFAKQQWKTIVPLLNHLPISAHDSNLVESWCILYSQRRKLQKELDNYPKVIYTYDEEGNIANAKRNPAYEMLIGTVKEMRMIGGQLGLTVSSRLEMIEPDEEEEQDVFLELIKGKGK